MRALVDGVWRRRYHGGLMSAPLTVKHWRRDEYERLVGLGTFRGEPIERRGGRIYVAEPLAFPPSAIAVPSLLP